jgi:hypothetical protein
MISLPIEISRTKTGFRVWFGTFATSRQKDFATLAEARAFARDKFNKSRTRFILENPGLEYE